MGKVAIITDSNSGITQKEAALLGIKVVPMPFYMNEELFFEDITLTQEQFYEKFDKECMEIPIFKYYDPYQMFQRISCASNEDIVSIKEKMLDRSEKYKKETEPEMKNIKQLKQIIDDYVKGKNIGIKTVLLREFAKELGTILEKYK